MEIKITWLIIIIVIIFIFHLVTIFVASRLQYKEVAAVFYVMYKLPLEVTMWVLMYGLAQKLTQYQYTNILFPAFFIVGLVWFMINGIYIRKTRDSFEE